MLEFSRVHMLNVACLNVAYRCGAWVVQCVV